MALSSEPRIDLDALAREKGKTLSPTSGADEVLACVDDAAHESGGEWEAEIDFTMVRLRILGCLEKAGLVSEDTGITVAGRITQKEKAA